MTAIVIIAVFLIIRLLGEPKKPTEILTKEVEYNNPVMIIQKGGRVLFTNAAFKKFFEISENSEVDLSSLSEKTNDPKQFFKVFTMPGTYELDIDGISTQVISVNTNEGVFVSFHEFFADKKDPNIADTRNIEKSEKFFSDELTELAKFSYSLKNIQDSADLFSRILNKSENLLPVEIFGFLLFDEQSKILEAKKPFKGLPDQIVDIIKTRIAPDSKAEKIIYSEDVLLTENAVENDFWADLELSHFAQAASIRDSILIPLSTGNEPMGFLLAANHINNAKSFSQDEIHSLMIIANQSAPIIENFFLLLQTKQRTQRAEALRRISSLVSSNATLEEIFTYSINELSQLLKADSGALFLINQQSSQLELDWQSKYGNWIANQDIKGTHLLSPEFSETATFRKEPLLLGKFDEIVQIPDFYEHILSHLALQSAVILPVILREEAIGELFFGSKSVSFFDQSDVNIISSAANLISNVIEKEKLSTQAFEAYQEKVEQEKLVHELQRIKNFNQRISSLDLSEILQAFLNESISLFSNVDSGWIGILDETSQILEPKFYHGISSSLRELKFTSESIFIKVVQDGNLIVKNNFDFPDYYSINEEQATFYLSALKYQIPVSCIIAPIKSREKPIGVLILEKFDVEEKFNDEDKAITQSLLQQVEIAITNAELFRKAELQTSRLKLLTDLSKSISATLDWEKLQKTLLLDLRKIVQFDTATLWVKEGNNLKIAETDGFTDMENRVGLVVQVEDSALFSEMFTTKKPVKISDKSTHPIFSTNFSDSNLSWLGVPLISQADVIGVIALEKKEKNFFTPDLVQLVENFASQAAIALTNANLYENSSSRLSHLDEQTRKLDWLNQYSTEVNQTLDIEQISLLTINYLTNLLHCDQASIFFLSAKNDEIEIFQNYPNSPEKKKISISDLPILQQLIQTHGTYFISDLSVESGFEMLKQHFLVRGTKAVLFVPLLHQTDIYGWIILESKENRRFFHEEVDLALTIANHTTLAIRNANLYLETKSLNENLEVRVEERSKDLIIEKRNTEMLLNISTELATSLDVDKILDRILAIINESIRISGSLIYILENKRIIQINQTKQVKRINIEDKLLSDSIQQAISTKDSVLKNNISMRVGGSNNSSWIFSPLIFGEVVMGVLVLFHQEPDYFSKRDVELSEAVAGQISLALNNAEIFNLVRDQSEYLGNMLREQEIETSRSKAILEAVADGVLVTDIHANIILTNQSATKILRIDATHPNSLDDLKTQFGLKIDNWISTIEKWTHNSQTLNAETGFSERIQLEENQFISVHLSPVIWKNEFLGTVSIFRDVSIEVQIDRLKSDFISNISHELRTPLTSIKGYVEILLMEASGKINNQQKSFLETIQSNTSRLTNLVDEILDVNKIGSKNIDLKMQPFNVVVLIKKLIDEKQIAVRESKKKLIIQINEIGDIPELVADPVRIEQVLNNILNNAIDYSQDNGEIKISISAGDQNVEIAVKDQGIGIPVEEQEFVFDRFYRGKNAVQMNIAGAGLGLAIAKTLVELQGGNIHLVSSGIPGEGVTVSISLPIISNEVISS